MQSPSAIEHVLALRDVLAFMLALFLGALLLPGPRVEGMPLAPPADDPGAAARPRTYKLSGMSLWIATHAWLALAIGVGGFRPASLIERFGALLVAANVVAIAWTWVLVRRGRAKLPAAARGEGALERLRDAWMGTELNPTWLGVDLKTWAYHPSLIGLALLQWGFAAAQYEQLGHLTPQMWLYQGFWWLYLTTHFFYERGVLSMWDVIAERFGFMLVWGDLVLVPFFYCVGGWTLLAATDPMPLATCAGLSVWFAVGLVVFRGANAQKDRFKRDPRATRIWGAPARALDDKLLISGWWGLGRKINYTGELMVYVAFALASTGGHLTPLAPLLLPGWLGALLLHRAWRDEQRCRAKYGALWDRYCAIARFRMIPGLW
jgi:delta14-sterol reductase